MLYLRYVGVWSLLLFLSAGGPNAAELTLVDAVKQGHTSTVRDLLEQRVDVNTTEGDGATALHWAVRTNQLETAELLIAAGANVAAENVYGVSPLSLACVNGNAAMIEALLDAGADVNTRSPEGETALMTAARTGTTAAVRVLLARGAEVDQTEGWRGQTALMWAAAEGYAPTVRALIEHGANLDLRLQGMTYQGDVTGGFTALLYAIRQGQLDVVHSLLEAGADVNEVLLFPAKSGGGQDTSGDGFTIKNLNAGGLPTRGPSAMVLAVINAHYELASLLLDAGADPTAANQGRTALHEITWVRKSGTANNNPAPAGSGRMDALDFVRKLVARGADVNAMVTIQPKTGTRTTGTTVLNMIGATPFLLAARTADVPLMRLLVELGADPLRPNEDGTTPLLAAAGVGTYSPGEDAGSEREVLEAVKLALELGGDPNAVDANSETAMHGVAYKQMPSVVPFLVTQGAKVDVWNTENAFGWTPLMIAEGVQRGNNIRTSEPTAAAIRQALENTN